MRAPTLFGLLTGYFVFGELRLEEGEIGNADSDERGRGLTISRAQGEGKHKGSSNACALRGEDVKVGTGRW